MSELNLTQQVLITDLLLAIGRCEAYAEAATHADFEGVGEGLLDCSATAWGSAVYTARSLYTEGDIPFRVRQSVRQLSGGRFTLSPQGELTLNA